MAAATKKTAGTGVAPTRCDKTPEIVVAAITLDAGDDVDLRLTLCNAAFRVAAHLNNELLVDQSPVNDEIDIALPELAPGLYGLSWSYLTNAASWKALSEISVNGVVRFRQQKGSVSTFPFQHSFVLLRVR